jgi:hypothetical protein
MPAWGGWRGSPQKNTGEPASPKYRFHGCQTHQRSCYPSIGYELALILGPCAGRRAATPPIIPSRRRPFGLQIQPPPGPLHFEGVDRIYLAGGLTLAASGSAPFLMGLRRTACCWVVFSWFGLRVRLRMPSETLASSLCVGRIERRHRCRTTWPAAENKTLGIARKSDCNSSWETPKAPPTELQDIRQSRGPDRSPLHPRTTSDSMPLGERSVIVDGSVLEPGASAALRSSPICDGNVLIAFFGRHTVASCTRRSTPGNCRKKSS